MMAVNNLLLNTIKLQVMVFGRKQMHLIKVKLNYQILQIINIAKNLGPLIDSGFCFHSLLNFLATRLSKSQPTVGIRMGLINIFNNNISYEIRKFHKCLLS